MITPRPANSNVALPGSLSMKSATGMMKAPDDINLIGFVSDRNPYNAAAGGMYHIPYRATQSLDRIGMMTIYNAWGGVEAKGTYYTVYQFLISETQGYNYLYKYDPSTWMSTGYQMLSDFSLFASCQSYDPTDELVYGHICRPTARANMNSAQPTSRPVHTIPSVLSTSPGVCAPSTRWAISMP